MSSSVILRFGKVKDIFSARLQSALLVCLLILAGPLSAQQSRAEGNKGRSVFGLGFDITSGFMHGTAFEYVYQDNKQLSRLEWEEHFVPYINLRGVFSVSDFFISGSARGAVPLKSGQMRDYDYLLAGSTALTNYSEHDAMLDYHFDFGGAAGYRFHRKRFELEPAFGYAYTARKWSAKDGFMQYASSGALQGNETKTPLSGYGITYDQKISYFHLSLRAGYLFFDRLLVSVNGAFIPYLWIETLDHHVLRSLEFYDTMKGGTGGSAGLSLRYMPFSGAAWSILGGFTWEKIPELRGESSYRSVGVNKPSEFTADSAQSGFESEIWDVFLGVNVNLFW
jgi:outer membrane protease